MIFRILMQGALLMRTHRLFERRFDGVVWDWGDTLMRDIQGQLGPMAEWERVEAMPGAASALEALAHVPVHCVATNAGDSDSRQVEAALARVGLRDRLTHFLTSSSLGHRKPAPAFFASVSRELGIPADRLISIGNDLENDILPAKAVGMGAILVTPAHRFAPAKGADLAVPGLVHLARLVAPATSSAEASFAIRL